MSFQFPNPLSHIPSIAYGIFGIAVAVVIFTDSLGLLRGYPKLGAFPTAGSSTLLGSWWGLKFVIDASETVREGYQKYKSAPFKISNGYKWIVILASRDHVEELARASEERFSLSEAFDDKFNIKYTMGHSVHEDPYHVGLIRFRLTRNIETIYSEIRDEIVTSFDDVLDLKDNEWNSVSVLGTINTIVGRVINRLIVGLPLCRDRDWIDINIQCSQRIPQDGFTIGLFPEPLKPLIACFFPTVARCTERSLTYIGPIIEERLKCMREYGDKWIDKPNDLLSWLMDEAKGKGSEFTLERLVMRVLFINFASIHSSSVSFTYTLLYLAANPQYIQPLREEVESVVQKEGWSKFSLGKMHKIDSFIKECQRMEGVSTIQLLRKALVDFTFSDGTFIPKGTTVASPSQCLQYDEQFYENPNVFQPFRFVHVCEEDRKAVKHQCTTTAAEYMPFGHGKHACPGRFFAAVELKSMLAHVVLTYDIGLEEGTSLPPSVHFATSISPDPSAKVLFRKRAI